MTRSIKLKNNTYIDSTSIVYNKEKLADILEKNIGIIKIVTLQQAMTIGAGEFTSVNIGAIPNYDDYTFIGIMNDTNGYGDQWLISYSSYGGNVVAMVHSKYGGILSSAITCKLLYIKNTYLE